MAKNKPSGRHVCLTPEQLERSVAGKSSLREALDVADKRRGSCHYCQEVWAASKAARYPRSSR